MLITTVPRRTSLIRIEYRNQFYTEVLNTSFFSRYSDKANLFTAIHSIVKKIPLKLCFEKKNTKRTLFPQV